MHRNIETAASAIVGSALVLAIAAAPSYAQEKKKVGYLATPLTNLYAAALSASVQKYGAEQGFDMLPSKEGQTYEAAEQVNNMNTMIDAGVQGIIIQISDGKGLKVALDKAEAAGVPVVTVDTSPDEGYGHAAMMVQVSSAALGAQGCEALGPAMGGKGKVLELQGSFQQQVGLLRSKGFNDCMKEKFPEIEVVQRQAEWSPDKSASITETVISTDPDVNGVFMAGDSVYVNSVINVLRRLDRLKKVGEEGHVAISGIDGDPAALQGIRDGYVDSIIAQPLTGYGKWGAYYLKAAFEGKKFEPGPTDHDSEIIKVGDNLADILKATVVTKENVDSPDLWANLKP